MKFITITKNMCFSNRTDRTLIDAITENKAFIKNYEIYNYYEKYVF